MEQEIIQKFYTMWTESKEYISQSAMENEKRTKCETQVIGAIGDQAYYDIGDNIMDLVCEAEFAGFENGLRYGIMFMNEIFKGNALNGIGKGGVCHE